MMQRQFERELDELKQQVLTMAGLTERALDTATRALVEHDPEAARAVIAGDDRIDQHEVEIDRLATEFIVRHQPLATDLRFVIVAVKLGPELERVADNAVNISRCVLDLEDQEVALPLPDLPRMLALARAMVADAIAAYVSRDADAAREVIRRDDEVDDLYWKVFREVLKLMIDNPETITRSIRLILVARYAERVADQATNMAEEVVYLVEGRPVRHASLEEQTAPPAGGDEGD
jgi:phosphate transport system protein